MFLGQYPNFMNKGFKPLVHKGGGNDCPFNKTKMTYEKLQGFKLTMQVKKKIKENNSQRQR
jgi:hypothetical protein